MPCQCAYSSFSSTLYLYIIFSNAITISSTFIQNPSTLQTLKMPNVVPSIIEFDWEKCHIAVGKLNADGSIEKIDKLATLLQP